MTFLSCFNGKKVSDGNFTFQLEENINGGFGGTNGGVLAALCVNVARDLAPKRIPSALDTRFIRGFRPGEASVSATVLNEGRSLSVISVDIHNSEGKLCVRSTVTLVAAEALAEIDVQGQQLEQEGLLPLNEGKVWPQPKGPQNIPLIDTFQPAYIGNNNYGTATAIQVIWQEQRTAAEAVCIAADISVGPPVARLVKGKAGIPNPDISLRFCGDSDVGENLLAFCKTENIVQGIATNVIKVFSGESLIALGSSTTTCIKLEKK
jgi:acyl-coenzyme A thioesterase PaaI-like protein